MYFDSFGITVDNVIFGIEDGELKILLVKRSAEPCINCWALPGGFIWKGETVLDCSKRILAEKINIKNLFLEQLQVFDGIGRDPRAQIFSIAYFGLVRKSQMGEIAGRDVAEIKWHPAFKLPKQLAFDHHSILQTAIKTLQKEVLFRPLVFQLLDKQFTLVEMQRLYEIILNKTMDKRNFRKKITAHPFIQSHENAFSTEIKQGKPAQLYAFDAKGFKQLEKGNLFVVII